MTDTRYHELRPDWTVNSVAPIHFVGIGGAGMSVIAQMYRTLGVAVTGSDAHESAVTSQLRDQGIQVAVPQMAENVEYAKTVVLSSAIREDNPEYVRAVERGATILHRSQALALLMRGRKAIAVAGAHGKTTTSAMVAVASASVGMDPSFAIGGSVRTPNGSIPGGSVGASDILVAEADESDGSFLNYEPYIAIVTNIEPDHLDHYGSREAFEEAFVQFSRRIEPTGALVACADDVGAMQLSTQAASLGKTVITYGTAGNADVRIRDIVQRSGEEGIEFTLSWASSVFVDGNAGSVRVSLGVPGLHNALNAAGAFAALMYLGAEPAHIAQGLSEFQGTGRRFEPRGQAAGVTVIDDYAHHPTEVKALLTAARVRAGEGRVIILFQPHLYSRTRIFAQEFAEALSGADITVLTSIYAAREDHDPNTSSQIITSKMDGETFYVADKWEAARRTADLAKPGDIVLTVGAGDVTELGPKIVEYLAQREN